MFRKYAVPLIALALLGFAVLHVVRAHAAPEKAPPPVAPGRAAFARTVAGVGIVEAQTENIAVGTPLSGVVAEVSVRVGQRVRAGTVLFHLDDRALRADLKARQANLAAAQAQLDRLKRLPRDEDVPPVKARLAEARANLELQARLLAISRNLYSARATSPEEFTQRKQAHAAAVAQMERAQAELKLLEAGAWAPDLAVARTSVGQAQAQVEQARVELDRLLVRAPVDGEVLQVNVRPGEFAAAQPGPAAGLVVLGNVGRLHVRVEIDEHDIHRFRPGTPARAALRGNPQVTFELSFVRVEPYVTPKRVLTNDSAERVDTRVLQVVYAVESKGPALYVGQQLDVSIEAAGPAAR
jgi:multidrug resistance efflux pump